MERATWRRWYQEHPRAVLGAAVLLLLLVIGLVGAARRSAPAPMPLGRLFGRPFQIIGFYENASPGEPSSWTSFRTHVGQLTTVSPRWFSLTASGQVDDIGYDPTMARFAAAHHVALVPLVTNANGTDGMLATAARRRAAAARLAALVRQDHLDGLNVDFELLPASDRDALDRFVQDLRRALGPHKVLAVSVFPLVGLPPSVNGADDYKGLAAAADYLVVMAYDHHYSGGPPGPVAPYTWVADNVAAARRLVPASKLVLAIGMYGYDWSRAGVPGSATTLSDVAVEALAKRLGIVPRYIPSESQSTFTYRSGGTTHVVWYMGDRSAAARAALARREHLAGIALWRLGYEDPDFWHAVGRP
ncbi:MAG: glycoside hydrolase [Actinomycetia bacterium]|nr:glycoside hydrolase [Actinomycetes bacterium]